jgi:hypothetical protein
MIKKYRVVTHRKNEVYNLKNGKSVSVTKSYEYSISCNGLIIANIPTYLPNAKSVVYGMVKILNNQSKIKLPDTMEYEGTD